MSSDHRIPVARVPAAGAGLLAMLARALLGTGAGAVTSRPLLHTPGRAVPALVLAVVLARSPAREALTDMVTGSQDGTVRTPLLPFAVGAVIALAATGVACALTSRHDH